MPEELGHIHGLPPMPSPKSLKSPPGVGIDAPTLPACDGGWDAGGTKLHASKAKTIEFEEERLKNKRQKTKQTTQHHFLKEKANVIGTCKASNPSARP